MYPTITANVYFLKVLHEEKQKEEDRQKMKEKVFRIMQDAARRTGKEVRGFKLHLKFKSL